MTPDPSNPPTGSRPQRRHLTVPDLAVGISVREAALAYARNGWFVGPLAPGTKNPGSLLGPRWPEHTARRRDDVEKLWAGRRRTGLFLHAGRSGALVFDIDHPDLIPSAILRAVEQLHPPFQSTRADNEGRGHYIFACPPAVEFGNSIRDLGSGWGEIRCRNAVIVAAPSLHEKAAEGGRYAWERTGRVPKIPTYLSKLLRPAGASVAAATDEQIDSFMASHRAASNPAALQGPINWLTNQIEAGASRHEATLSALGWAMREAARGTYAAAVAAEAILEVFYSSFDESELR